MSSGQSTSIGSMVWRALFPPSPQISRQNVDDSKFIYRSLSRDLLYWLEVRGCSTEDVLRAIDEGSIPSEIFTLEYKEQILQAIRWSKYHRNGSTNMKKTLQWESANHHCESQSMSQPLSSSCSPRTQNPPAPPSSQSGHHQANPEAKAKDLTIPRTSSESRIAYFRTPSHPGGGPYDGRILSQSTYEEVVGLAERSCRVKPQGSILYLITKSDSHHQWRTEISNTSMVEKEDPYAVSLCALPDNALIDVRSAVENVGPPMQLSQLKSYFRYNPSLVAKIDVLEEYYSGCRRIRGDGNCYYRCCIFGLMSQIIESGDRILRFHQLKQRFENYYNGGERKCELFLRYLEKAAAFECWPTVDDFEADVDFDEIMIYACRKLVSSFLVRNKDMQLNGMALQDLILPAYPEVSTIEEYCTQFVEEMGCDAEGPFVELGVLFVALGCFGMTVFLDRRADVPLNFFEVNPKTLEADVPVVGTVHILLRPGHYDLLYPSKESTEVGVPTYSAAELATKCNEELIERGAIVVNEPPDKQRARRQNAAVKAAKAIRARSNTSEENPERIRIVHKCPDGKQLDMYVLKSSAADVEADIRRYFGLSCHEQIWLRRPPADGETFAKYAVAVLLGGAQNDDVFECVVE